MKTTIIETPLGTVRLAADHGALLGLWFRGQQHEPALPGDSLVDDVDADPALRLAADWLIEHLRERVSVIALTRDNSSPLATLATLVVPTGHHAEAGELGLAPTCSTTAMLALGDALSIVLARIERRGTLDADDAGLLEG